MWCAGQSGFHLFAQLAARTVELPRDGGFVLAKQAANLRERQVLHVIIGKPQTVARRERGKRRRKRGLEQREIALALGIR